MQIKEPDGSGTVCSNAESFFKDIAPKKKTTLKIKMACMATTDRGYGGQFNCF